MTSNQFTVHVTVETKGLAYADVHIQVHGSPSPTRANRESAEFQARGDRRPRTPPPGLHGGSASAQGPFEDVNRRDQEVQWRRTQREYADLLGRLNVGSTRRLLS